MVPLHFLPNRFRAEHKLILKPTGTKSEERRVGKESRYRWEWCSEVCYSDLAAVVQFDPVGMGARSLGRVIFHTATYTDRIELHHGSTITELLEVDGATALSAEPFPGSAYADLEANGY